MVKRTHIILVDFENVQPTDFNLLNDIGESFKLKIFLGPNQSKIDAKMAAILQTFGQKVEYVFVTKGGKNALDFFIAYELGASSSVGEQSVNTVTYCLISKDTGFDPLVLHLKEKKISIGRFNTVGNIPHLKVKSPTCKSIPTQSASKICKFNLQKSVLLATQSLRKYKSTLPSTKNTLLSNLCSTKINRSQAGQIFSVLCKQGIVEVNENDGSVKFNL